MSNRRAVADFPPEYFDVWALAAKGTLCLEFPSKGFATNKKVDLQRFRKRLSEENPELATVFFNVDLLVREKPGEAGAQLVAYVPDWKKQVRKQIAASDLSSPALTAIAEEVVEQQQEQVDDSMGAVIKDLGFKSPS